MWFFPTPFSWFLHRWTVLELQQLLSPLLEVLGREQRMPVFQELFNLMSDPKDKIWVLGFCQVRPPLELVAQDLELEPDVMCTPLSPVFNFLL